MKITSVEQHKQLAGELAAAQHEYGFRAGGSIERAADDIVKKHGFNCTGAELRSEMGRFAATGYTRKERKGKTTNDETTKSWISLYRSWCNEKEFVPRDTLLAHFTTATPGAFQTARTTLSSEGFVFDKVDNGWDVVKRPSPAVVKSENHNQPSVDEIVRAVLAVLGKQ